MQLHEPLAHAARVAAAASPTPHLLSMWVPKPLALNEMRMLRRPRVARKSEMSRKCKRGFGRVWQAAVSRIDGSRVPAGCG